MIIKELAGNEDNPVYQELLFTNAERQYDFIRSIVAAGIKINRPFLSSQVIKALNFHAITCLDICAGEYRPCSVTVGDYEPPSHYRVPALMDDFVNSVNFIWKESDPIVLASYVLWMMNAIHPFTNGNGRTARAACYFVLCTKAGGVLAGKKMLPELLRERRGDYIVALKAVDESSAGGVVNLKPLQELLVELIQIQLASVDAESNDAG